MSSENLIKEKQMAAKFFITFFAVILLCTKTNNKKTKKSVLEDSMSKIRSSKNRSTLTKYV